MPCGSRVSAAVLLSNMAMSAAGETQEKGLSGCILLKAKGTHACFQTHRHHRR